MESNLEQAIGILADRLDEIDLENDRRDELAFAVVMNAIRYLEAQL